MTRSIGFRSNRLRCEPSRSPKLLFTIFCLSLCGGMGCGSGQSMDVQKWAIRAADRRPVIKDRELMILDLSVVDDPGRTIEPCDRTADDLPVWSFGWLMSRIAE